MSEIKIPKHRHQVNARSAEPRFIEGGNDDRGAAPKKARVRKAAKPKVAPPAESGASA
jgi:hypothetical protein